MNNEIQTTNDKNVYNISKIDNVNNMIEIAKREAELLTVSSQFAKSLMNTSFCPKAYHGKEKDLTIAIHFGYTLGLKPMFAIQNLAIINDKPVLWGDAALALVQSTKELENFEEFYEGEGQKLTAICKVKRKGQAEHKVSYSVEDAIKAGQWQTDAFLTTKEGKKYANPSPWFKYPKRMLQMKARGFGLRDTFPDVLLGLYLAEEIDIRKDDTKAYEMYNEKKEYKYIDPSEQKVQIPQVKTPASVFESIKRKCPPESSNLQDVLKRFEAAKPNLGLNEVELEEVKELIATEYTPF